MKDLYKKILVLIPFFLFVSVEGQDMNNSKEKADQIIRAHKGRLEDINQLLVVFNEDETKNKAVLIAFEKKGKNWETRFGPLKASIGRTGFAKPGTKSEGDGKSPTGLFALGQLFSYESAVNTKLPFIQINAKDKWIDDPASAGYNTYVRGNTTAKSFEKLLLNSIDYKYCMVIEYNTHPVIKGRGSAIFFHLADDVYTATEGCVAISEADMKEILLWMRPVQKRSILMGTREELMAGF